MPWIKGFDNSVLPQLIDGILRNSEEMREIELEQLSGWHK